MVTVRCWWARPRETFWPADHDRRRCWRLAAAPAPAPPRAGAAGRPAGRRAGAWTSPGGSGLGRVRSSSRVYRSKNSSDWPLDPDADLAAAEDLRRQHLVPAQADQPAAVDHPFHLDRVPSPRRQRRRPGRERALGGQLGQVGHRQVRAHGLDPRPGDEQMDHSQSAQNRTTVRRGRTEPELLPGRSAYSRLRHHPLELHRASRITPAGLRRR